ncbi:PREDICTED: lanC-like protein 3 [Papilio xuthus]|uniref:LanC-like protein 3 homolog n=1 Tax=Papilio xuthus TaxID=66420 RepID=A0AAJ7E4Y8_PAPXU|nr:PREDICTED: lanC-like protein 3 [Papilio xuthus]
MNKGLKKLFSFQNISKFLYAFTPSATMVRYFPNPYVEEGIVEKEPSHDDLTLQINEYIKNITTRLQPSNRNVDGGLYVGVTGVSYMFYYLFKNPLLKDSKSFYIEKAVEYLQPALDCSAGERTSFLLGDAGTFALAAVVFKAKEDERYTDFIKNYKALYNQYLNPKFLKCGGDEFFVGRAGYLAGALWMHKELHIPVLTREEMYNICDVMVESGRDYSMKSKSRCPLMYHYYNTQYLGAAHGLSFILQMLLTVPGYLQFNTSAEKDVKATVEYIASLQTKEGNWPCCMEELVLDDHKLIHWCHGAPGTVYLMAKAYLIFHDQRFLDSCIKAGEVVWQKGLLRKGPGICHGIAGNGYVFLLLYRLTGDDIYLHRAKMFANFMKSEVFIRDSRLPDNPESLYEGIAGTVCFLSDLLTPEIAEFPFQDVFSNFNQ